MNDEVMQIGRNNMEHLRNAQMSRAEVVEDIQAPGNSQAGDSEVLVDIIPDVSMREFHREEGSFKWDNDSRSIKFDGRKKVPLVWGNGGEPIGYSSKAIVFEADARRVRNYPRRLACKVVNCEDREVSVETAWDEVRNMLGLRHPHIVALVGAYIQGDSLGILMYPVARGNLHDYMRKISNDIKDAQSNNGSVSADTIAMIDQLPRWFVCLGEGLAYLHRKRIKHKDIKPKNMLIDQFGAILLSDFDISHKYKEQEKLESQGPTAFTPMYSAPEVVNRGPTRFLNTDVFSLGCVFLEMATLVGGKDHDALLLFRVSGNDKSYQATLLKNIAWMKSLQEDWQRAPTQSSWGQSDVREGSLSDSTPSRELLKALPQILEMMNRDPTKRPPASSLRTRFKLLRYPPCSDCGDHTTTNPESDLETWDGEPPLPELPEPGESSMTSTGPDLMTNGMKQLTDLNNLDLAQTRTTNHQPESVRAPSVKPTSRQPTVEFRQNGRQSRKCLAYYQPLNLWCRMALEEVEGYRTTQVPIKKFQSRVEVRIDGKLVVEADLREIYGWSIFLRCYFGRIKVIYVLGKRPG